MLRVCRLFCRYGGAGGGGGAVVSFHHHHRDHRDYRRRSYNQSSSSYSSHQHSSSASLQTTQQQLWEQHINDLQVAVRRTSVDLFVSSCDALALDINTVINNNNNNNINSSFHNTNNNNNNKTHSLAKCTMTVDQVVRIYSLLSRQPHVRLRGETLAALSWALTCTCDLLTASDAAIILGCWRVRQDFFHADVAATLCEIIAENSNDNNKNNNYNREASQSSSSSLSTTTTTPNLTQRAHELCELLLFLGDFQLFKSEFFFSSSNFLQNVCSDLAQVSTAIVGGGAAGNNKNSSSSSFLENKIFNNNINPASAFPLQTRFFLVTITRSQLPHAAIVVPLQHAIIKLLSDHNNVTVSLSALRTILQYVTRHPEVRSVGSAMLPAVLSAVVERYCFIFRCNINDDDEDVDVDLVVGDNNKKAVTTDQQDDDENAQEYGGDKNNKNNKVFETSHMNKNKIKNKNNNNTLTLTPAILEEAKIVNFQIGDLARKTAAAAAATATTTNSGGTAGSAAATSRSSPSSSSEQHREMRFTFFKFVFHHIYSDMKKFVSCGQQCGDSGGVGGVGDGTRSFYSAASSSSSSPATMKILEDRFHLLLMKNDNNNKNNNNNNNDINDQLLLQPSMRIKMVLSIVKILRDGGSHLVSRTERASGAEAAEAQLKRLRSALWFSTAIFLIRASQELQPSHFVQENQHDDDNLHESFSRSSSAAAPPHHTAPAPILFEHFLTNFLFSSKYGVCTTALKGRPHYHPPRWFLMSTIGIDEELILFFRRFSEFVSSTAARAEIMATTDDKNNNTETTASATTTKTEDLDEMITTAEEQNDEEKTRERQLLIQPLFKPAPPTQDTFLFRAYCELLQPSSSSSSSVSSSPSSENQQHASDFFVGSATREMYEATRRADEIQREEKERSGGGDDSWSDDETRTVERRGGYRSESFRVGGNEQHQHQENRRHHQDQQHQENRRHRHQSAPAATESSPQHQHHHSSSSSHSPHHRRPAEPWRTQLPRRSYFDRQDENYDDGRDSSSNINSSKKIHSSSPSGLWSRQPRAAAAETKRAIPEHVAATTDEDKKMDLKERATKNDRSEILLQPPLTSKQLQSKRRTHAFIRQKRDENSLGVKFVEVPDLL